MLSIRSGRAFSAATFLLVFGLALVGCGKKNGASAPNPQTPVAGTPPVQVVNPGMDLTGIWTSNCVADDNAIYQIEFSSNDTLYWQTETFSQPGCKGTQKTDVKQYDYRVGKQGALSSPKNGTSFDFYNVGDSYVEYNAIVYDMNTKTFGLGDWDQSSSNPGDPRPSTIRATFSRTSDPVE